MEWLESLLLGVVQGVTEFLPVSSDGHLAITQQGFAGLTGSPRSGRENLFFDIMLHVGTLAAILYHARSAIVQGVAGLLAPQQASLGFDRATIVRLGLLAGVATSPLVPFALFFKNHLEEMFQSTYAAGVGFLITATVLLLVTARLWGPDGTKGPRETTYIDALLIGIAQMFAPFPGVSRSGLTIAAALALGLSRTWSVGFSLLIAVPAICGAAVLELKDAIESPASLGLTPDRITQTIAATVVAGIVGYAAILWLIRVVRSGRLWYFSVYLIALGVIVLFLASRAGQPADDRSSKALDRTPIGGHSRPHDHGARRPAGIGLGHAHAAGLPASCACPGARRDSGSIRASALLG